MLRPQTPHQKAEHARVAQIFREAYEGSPAQAYVTGRGIGDRTAWAHMLGYVPEGVLGWEQFAGRLAIPYINMNRDVVWFKFRALNKTSVKYMQQAGGDGTRLFNVQALNAKSDTLVLCEGEFDTITLTALGIPSIGIPGAKNWKAHHKRALDGWPRILVLHDDDEPGRDLVKAIRAKMPDVLPLRAPGGFHDINEAFKAGQGPRIVAMVNGDPDPGPTDLAEEEVTEHGRNAEGVQAVSPVNTSEGAPGNELAGTETVDEGGDPGGAVLPPDHPDAGAGGDPVSNAPGHDSGGHGGGDREGGSRDGISNPDQEPPF